MPRTKASIHHWFPTAPDAKLPSQWHIRFRQPGPPFKLLVFLDNPLSIREELRTEEKLFANPKWFTFKGRIAPGKGGNPTDKTVVVEEVEVDVPAEIIEDTAKVLRVKFTGKKLKGTVVFNRDLKQSFVQESGHRKKKKKKGRKYEDKDITVLASPDGTVLVEVDGDPDDDEFAALLRASLPGFEVDVLEAVYRVRYDGNDAFFRTAAAAREFAKGFKDARVSRLNRLPPGQTLRERVHGLIGMLFAIRGGKFMVLTPDEVADARKLRGAGRFALVFEDRSARVAGPERMAAIEAGKAARKGQFLVAREVAMDVYRAGQAVFESMTRAGAIEAAARFIDMTDADGLEELVEAADSFAIAAGIPFEEALERLGRRLESGFNPDSGIHEHPHVRDGIHPHWFDGDPPGVVVGGGHGHEDKNIGGAHRHRPGDPLEGQHLNVGQGAHDHLLAKGLEDYIRWSVDAHHPKHAWLPGHVRTWIRHVGPDAPEEKDFRLATADDWREHTIWSMHSTGAAKPSAHVNVFIDPKTRVVVKEYEFEDGTRREPTDADFLAEERWFRDNTPRDLRQRLAEGMVSTDRYQALGIPYPDPKTMCLGPCEGTGWVPVYVNIPALEGDETRCRLEDEPDLVLRALWDAAESKKPCDDGWHFVACPECEGTGRRASEFDKDNFKPTESTDAQLDDDWRLMAAKFGAMIEGGKTEFDTVAELVRFAGLLVEQILIRGKLVLHTAESKPHTVELLRRTLARIVTGGMEEIQAPGGCMIAEGKRTATITAATRKGLEQFRILVKGDEAFGYVRHATPRVVDLAEFAKARDQHRVSDEVRKRDFPDRLNFQLYPVREFVPFEKARKVEYAPPGVMEFKVQFQEDNDDAHVSSLSNLELIALHGRLHTLWNHHGGGAAKDEVMNRHIKVLAELRRRGLEHRPKDTLDQETAARGGPEVELGDVAKLFSSPIVLKKPFLAVVGGVAVSGHGKDLDIWINWPTLDDDFARILMFRIKSMLPSDVNVEFMCDPNGPFTSHMPLADLEVRFVPREKRQVIQMSEQTKHCMTRAEGMAVRKRREDSYPEGFYRIFHHYRSKSAHKDFRYVAEKGGFLRGWTMTDQPAGAIKQDVDTVDEGYRVQRVVPWKFTPDMDPSTKVVAVPKARQPLLWMNALNVFIEEGKVGASADGPGVFTVCDEGTVHLGVDKADFKEFFFDGKIFKGRTGYRLISTAGFGRNGDDDKPKQAVQWQVSTNLKDQTPNILSSRERRRTRDQQWVPPEGFMAIPPRPVPGVPIHAGLIKEEHHWWASGLSPAKRLDRLRDAFNDLVDRKLLAARKLESGDGQLGEVTVKFLLRRFFFKGATVVRGLPRFWYSLIWRQGGKVKEVRFEDQVNPLRRLDEKMFVSVIRQDIPSKEAPPGSNDPVGWFTFPEGKEIPPSHPLNPNKRIPVFVEKVDDGEITTFSDTDLVLTFRAKGKKFKGSLIVRRPKASDTLWEFGRTRLPGERRREVAHGKAPSTEKTASRG